MARMVHCVKLAREAEGLDFPPYPGELGKPKARKYLEEQMVNHFFGSGADRAAGYVPPEKP